MKKVHIDFAAPGWRRGWHLLPPGVLGAIALGLALCAGAALDAYRMVRQQRVRDAALLELARGQQARHSRDLAAAARQAELARMPEAQARAVNDAVLQLNLPWRELRDAVAAATPAGIALLALEPDPGRQMLKISAEAASADDMIAYVEQLKRQEFFTGAALLRHEFRDRQQDGGQNPGPGQRLSQGQGQGQGLNQSQSLDPSQERNLGLNQRPGQGLNAGGNPEQGGPVRFQVQAQWGTP